MFRMGSFDTTRSFRSRSMFSIPDNIHDKRASPTSTQEVDDLVKAVVVDPGKEDDPAAVTSFKADGSDTDDDELPGDALLTHHDFAGSGWTPINTPVHDADTQNVPLTSAAIHRDLLTPLLADISCTIPDSDIRGILRTYIDSDDVSPTATTHIARMVIPRLIMDAGMDIPSQMSTRLTRMLSQLIRSFIAARQVKPGQMVGRGRRRARSNVTDKMKRDRQTFVRVFKTIMKPALKIGAKGVQNLGMRGKIASIAMNTVSDLL